MKTYKKRKPDFYALQWTGENIGEFRKEFSNVDENHYSPTSIDVGVWKQKKREWADYTLAVGQYIVRSSKSGKVKVLDKDEFFDRYVEKSEL